MPVLHRTRSYAFLDLWTGAAGVPADAYSIECRVYDISTPAKLLAPVQTYPAAVGSVFSAHALDLVADRLDTGHYRITWTPGATEPTGRHRVVWISKQTATGAEAETTEEFDVVAVGTASWGYCLPCDLRDEGLTTTDATDQRLVNVIALSTKMIEQYTGRFFEPRAQTLKVDGGGGHALQLHHPIISVTRVELLSCFDALLTQILDTDLRVYNRHLTHGLVAPDDRNNPKIEMVALTTMWPASATPVIRPWSWPNSPLNVNVVGVFGYTDPDGSTVGATPLLIRHACKLLVMREFPTLTAFDDREDRRDRWRLTSERTRDQARGMATRKGNGLTGDAEVDFLLDGYRRPPMFGAA